MFSLLSLTKSLSAPVGSIITTEVGTVTAIFQVITNSSVSFGSNNTAALKSDSKSDDLYIPHYVEYNEEDYAVTELAPFCLSKVKFNKIYIPASIKKIANHAFFLADIEEIDLSQSKVTVIPQYCFASSAAKVILLPNTVRTIGKYSFYSTLITEMEMPSELTYISARAFDLSLLKTCNLSATNVKSIDHYAFSSSMLTKFIPSDTLESIGSFAFAETPLKYIILPNKTTTISEHCFENCINLKLADLSSTCIPCIPSYCFYNCISLGSCKVPETLEYVDSFAFYNSSIPFVKFGRKIETLARCAFMRSCIQEIDLSKTSIKIIERMCFAQCDSLSYFIPSQHLEMINEIAFSNTSLKAVNLPSSTSELGLGAFYFCKELVSADLSRTQLTSIPSQCFQNCFKLSNITLNRNIESIGNASFCRTIIETVDISGDLKSIGEYSFALNPSLRFVDLSGSRIITILAFAFRGCTSLVKVKLPASTKEILNGAFYESSIKKFFGQKNMKALGSQLFMSSSCEKCDLSLTSIDTIPGHMFSNCRNLTEVVLPKKLKFISPGSFFNCSISELKLPTTITAIAPTSFAICDNLKELDFSKTHLHEIGRQAFFKCSNLTTLLLPNTVRYIGSTPFALSGITNLDIPDDVEFIAHDAFRGMSNLKVLNISKIELESLRDSKTFEDLSSLETIYLPPILTYANKLLFWKCYSLKNIHYYGTNDLSPKCKFYENPTVYVSSDYKYEKIFGIRPIVKDIKPPSSNETTPQATESKNT